MWKYVTKVFNAFIVAVFNNKITCSWESAHWVTSIILQQSQLTWEVPGLPSVILIYKKGRRTIQGTSGL